MNNTMETLLAKAKVNLRITTDVFDDEISDIIKAGIEDIETRGVMIRERMSSPIVLRAILTYTKLHFSEPESPERLKASYDEQLTKLMTTTNFTKWGSCHGQK